MIDAIIKEFNDLVGESFGVNWGSDDVTKSTVYAQYEYEDICETYETDEFKKAIKELTLKDGFYVERCMQVYLDAESTEESKKKLEAFYPIEVENVKKYISKFNKNAKYWEIEVDIEDIENNCGWQFLEFVHYGLTDDTIEQLKNELKGDNMNTLKEKVIDEVMTILNEVRDVQKLMYEFNINVSSDTWTATDIERNKVPNYNENILDWNRKDFEQTNFQEGDSFLIGGNITTGCEHQFKNEWIIAPKKLAEVQGEIVKEYLESIINNQQCEYIDLSFYDPHGLLNNCGWEHYMCIKATVNCDITTDEKTKALLDEIMEEGDHIIELSGCPVEEKPNNMFSEETGLQPQGDFAYMVEFLSFHLIDEDDSEYQGGYGLNNEYIKDAMFLINRVENKAEILRQNYEDKGVKVTVNGLNDGCQGGLAVYVWIPYQ